MESQNNRLCDTEGVKRAINRYCGVDRFGHIEITIIPISQLELEFGKDAFDSELLNEIWDNLSLMRCGDNVRLGPIIFNSLRNWQYWSLETLVNLPVAEFEEKYKNSHRKPKLNPSWLYTKCLLRIFQSDPRTRSHPPDCITDQELGI
jgi:hypothetical protein